MDVFRDATCEGARRIRGAPSMKIPVRSTRARRASAGEAAASATSLALRAGAVGVLLAVVSASVAEESAAQKPGAKGSDEATRAAEFLQSVVESMHVRREGKDEKALRPRAKPLLKYSDAARGYSAAGVWRLGEAGRPRGLVSLEYWPRGETNEPRLMF